MEELFRKETHPPGFTFFRILMAMWRQKHKTPNCPDQPRLDGKLAIVTGGNSGIGFETSRGLAERGAEVIILSRNEAKSLEAIKKIKEEFDSKVHFIRTDLSDIESVIIATKEIAQSFPERKVDILVANAGITTHAYSTSSQGYEKGFAVNVLGHHILFKACLSKSILANNAHVISLAGDIYILQKNSPPNYFTNEESVKNSYCQSKLGVMWWSYELMQKYQNLSVNIVHPGVVATDLGGGTTGALRRFIRGKLMLSPKEGAQTTLICATQNYIVNGAYYHNTMGQVILPADDPATNYDKAEEFWNLLEEITSVYLNNI